MDKEDITNLEDALKDVFAKENKEGKPKSQGNVNIENELQEAFKEKEKNFPKLQNVEERIGYGVPTLNRPLTLEEIIKIEDEKAKQNAERRAKERTRQLNETKKERKALRFYQSARILEKQTRFKENGLTAKDILIKARETALKNNDYDTFDIMQQAIEIAIKQEENSHGEFYVKPNVYERKMKH